jgi:hypothetical protein
VGDEYAMQRSGESALDITGAGNTNQKPENTITIDSLDDPTKVASLFVNRRPPIAKSAQLYYAGDHWQRGQGFIGAKPLDRTAAYQATLAQIEHAFVSENIIAEVVDRHVSGLLGREPLWGFIPKETVSAFTAFRRKLFAKTVALADSISKAVSDKPAKTTPTIGEKTTQTASQAQGFAQEADDALTIWWDTGEPLKILKQALTNVLLEKNTLLRFYIPSGYVNAEGKIGPVGNLADALKMLRVDIVTQDLGGEFKDANLQIDFGAYIYASGSKENSTTVDTAELTFVSEGMTVLRVIAENKSMVDYSYDLNGELLMHEVTRKPFVTPQLVSNQKALNLSDTMMMRNVNLAGSLERTVMNAERPKRPDRKLNPDTGIVENVLADAPYLTGPGATMFLTGLLIRDDKGNIIGRSNPNISFREPIAVTNFVETRNHYYEAILGQTNQLHVLIAGDANASGFSREQARGEYKSSLLESKTVIDNAGRWLMSVALRWAALLCAREKDFANLRCEFNSVIDTGPISSLDRAANLADVNAGLLSKETAMSRNGVDDTDAEKMRIDEEKKAAIELAQQQMQQNPPKPPQNNNSPQNQQGNNPNNNNPGQQGNPGGANS